MSAARDLRRGTHPRRQPSAVEWRSPEEWAAIRSGLGPEPTCACTRGQKRRGYDLCDTCERWRADVYMGADR